MRIPSLAAPLVVASMLAVAFTGCLAATTEGAPTISRVHTLTLSRGSTERAAEHEDDPMAALRELLVTDLVVRVQEAGDYSLEYTDATGAARTFAITGATPSTPVVVSGADPIAPAILKKGDETVSVRAGIAADWWHAGDFPLGFNLTGASKAVYAYSMRLDEAITITDLDVPEMEASIESLAFSLLVPVEGTASWELQPDESDGSPVLLAADIRVAPGAGDLLTLDLRATQAGQPGTAGITSGLDEARASASAKLWFRDGEPAAAQFLGAESKIVPRATMWADGFFAELAGEAASGSPIASCVGASRADACVPEALETIDHKEPAGTKETFEADDLPRAVTDEEREAVQLLQRIFAQDIVPGDKATVRAIADQNDLGTGIAGPKGDVLFEFTIEAVAVEKLTVRAGTFEALKILETMRTKVDVRDLQGPDGRTIVSAYALDETVARTTFWLDAKTYQPLKMEASTPFDAEALLKNALDAVDASAWDALGGKPIEDAQWSLRAVAESSYEAIEHEPGAHFSALVGLGLAHGVTGAAGSTPFAIFGMSLGNAFGPGMGTPPPYAEEAYYGGEYAYEPPQMSLSIVSAGPLMDGRKSYTIVDASEGAMWGNFMVTLDGEGSWLEWSDAGCAAPFQGYTACRGEIGLDHGDEVLAGDTFTLVASEGQTLRILDLYSNSVILTVTVS